MTIEERGCRAEHRPRRQGTAFYLPALIVVVPCMLSFRGAAGQESRPAGASLQGTITGVEGIVQVRSGEDQPWQAAKVGMVVGEGSELRTGPRSAVRIAIPPDQTITLDRLGTARLLQAVRSGNKIKTDIGMKYGRVRYGIEAAGEDHDTTIHAPGSTLGVRATQVSIYDQGFYLPVVTSLTGRASFTDSRGLATAFGGKDAGKAVLVAGSGGAAYTALHSTYIDPSFSLAHSPAEAQAIISTPTVSGLSFGTSISEVRRRESPAGATPSKNVPGTLVFQLVWVGSSPSAPAPDLDLFVRSPLGELLGPKDALAYVPSGGHSAGDDTGGDESRPGQETAFWAGSFPPGLYVYSVRHVDGSPGEFQVAVTRDGQLAARPVAGTLDRNGTVAAFTIAVLRKPPIRPGGHGLTAANGGARQAAPLPGRAVNH